jgi:hypothetical protein
MIPKEQAQDALDAGGVNQFADTQPHSPEFTQVANLFSEIFKRTLKQSGSAVDTATDAAGDVVPGTEVPMPSTERLMPDGTSYSQVQDANKANLLSPQGVARFDAAGGDASIATNLPADPLELDEALSTSALSSDEIVQQQAKNANANKASGFFNEGDTLDVFDMYVNRGVLVNTDEGIDFNFDKLDSGEDILAVINAVSEIIKDPTEAAKRGVKANTETLEVAQQKLADELGFTKKILQMKSGSILNAEDMTALRILLQKSADKLATIAREIEAGNDSTEILLKFRKQMSIHAGIQMRAKGAQTEIARALQAFNIPVGARTNVEIASAAQDLLNETGGRKLAKDLSKGYLKALNEGGQAAANKYAAGGWNAKTKAVFHEIYINGMLAWPKTHLKNFFATPLFMVYNNLVDLTAASAGAIKGMAFARDPQSIYFGDVFARQLGQTMAIRDAFVTAYKTWKDEAPADQLNKIEASQFKAIDSESLGVSGWQGRGVDWFGRMIRQPGRFLMGADDFWRVIASKGVLYEEAYKKARISLDNGNDMDTAIDDGMMVLLDPRSVSSEMDHAARYATLTEEVDGGLGEVTRSVQKNFIGKLLIPFAKAPTNAIKMVAQGHPLGLVSQTIRDDLFGVNGAQAAMRARSRLAFGTSTMALVFHYAQTGRMTGAMPSDQDIRNQLPKGWQPYSFVFRGDDWPVGEDGSPLPLYDKFGIPNGALRYVSFAGLEPVSAFFGIAADTAEKMRRFEDPADQQDFLGASLLATVDYFKQLPFLQGMSSVFAALEYEDPSIILQSPMSNVYGIAPMPYSAVVRNVDKLIDSSSKTVSSPVEYYSLEDVQSMFAERKGGDNELDEVPYHLVGTVKTESSAGKFFKDAFVNTWLLQNKSNPWYQEHGTDYQYQYDVLGERRQRAIPFSANPYNALWNSLTPFSVSTSEALPEWKKELIKLGVPLSVQKKSLFGIPLSKAFRGELNEVAKNQITLPVNKYFAPQLFRKHLESLILSIEFRSLDKDEQINMIKRHETKFYKEAFMRLIQNPKYADIMKAYTQHKLIKDQLQ